MKHIWSVLCSRAVIDRDTNNISLQNVIEQLNIQAEPSEGAAIPFQMEVVTFWTRDDPETPIRENSRVKLLSPKGKTIGSFEAEIDMTDHERSRSKLTLQGLPISSEGIFLFRIERQHPESLRWRKVAELPLQVSFSPPENSPETALP